MANRSGHGWRSLGAKGPMSVEASESKGRRNEAKVIDVLFFPAFRCLRRNLVLDRNRSKEGCFLRLFVGGPGAPWSWHGLHLAAALAAELSERGEEGVGVLIAFTCCYIVVFSVLGFLLGFPFNVLVKYYSSWHFYVR